MRLVILGSLCLLLGATTLAKDEPRPRPNPPRFRQGGDTIASAVVIPALPFADTGSTAGFADDYAGSCLVDNGAADVVYSLTVAPGIDQVDISLCGSGYDTGLYVFDSGLTEIACNDDDCGLQSQLDRVPVTAGETYYVILDGYGSDFGDYVLAVAKAGPPCVLVCPDGGVAEGEPPLQNDAPLAFNCGCQCADPGLMSVLAGDAGGNLAFCARNGWQSFGTAVRRDDDYLSAHVGDAGVIHIEVDAELGLYLVQFTTDCSDLITIQQVLCGPCDPEIMEIAGEPGEPVVLFAVAGDFGPPAGETTPYEFDYTLTISGLMATVATENASWGAVKSLFR